MKRIVITGATSMIGIALISKALQSNEIKKVYAVVRSGSKKMNRLVDDPRIQVILCECSNYSTLEKLISEKCDVFYHLAWSRTATYQEYYDDVIEKCKNIRVELEE